MEIHIHIHHHHEGLNIVNNKLDKIMGQNEDLQAAADSLSAKVDTLKATVDTKQAAIAQAIKDLEAKVQPDLQPIIDSLKATEAKIDSATADVDSTPTA